MDAEVQQAFAETAARNIPPEHLKPDLPSLRRSVREEL
jgi:hypothetical protein